MFVDVRRKTAHNVIPKLSSGETAFTSGQQADYKQLRYSSTVKTDKEKRDEACDHVTATLEPGSLTTKVENVIKALDDIRNESSSESSDESSDESNKETQSNLGKDAKTQAESIRSFDKNQKFIEKCVQNIKGQNPCHLSERLIALKEFPLKVFKLYAEDEITNFIRHNGDGIYEKYSKHILDLFKPKKESEDEEVENLRTDFIHHKFGLTSYQFYLFVIIPWGEQLHL